MKTHQEYIIRVLCDDRPGILARMTALIADQGGNVLDLEEHVEKESGLFASRIYVENLASIEDFKEAFPKGLPLKNYQIWTNPAHYRPKVAILVTQEETCLYDLLIKQKMAEINFEIPLIISNREDLKPVARQFQIPFYYFPIEGKKNLEQEKKIEAKLEEYQIDLVILARYMRILSPQFVSNWTGRMINIHHSFLPAFKGAKPYHQAWKRGVKMIGASAHYVTADLDEGPIIHQSAMQVSHHYSVTELTRAGRELERSVLAQAVRAHLEHRVLLIGKRTIVFHF